MIHWTARIGIAEVSSRNLFVEIIKKEKGLSEQEIGMELASEHILGFRKGYRG